MVRDVIGFTDGVSIPVQCASDKNRQTTDYNGHHHDTMCNNVFCFAPSVKIIYSCINFPGSFHDSQVSVGLINVVLVHTRTHWSIQDMCGSRLSKIRGYV